jgi:hypothetical protein
VEAIMAMKKLTPVFVVDDIAPCVAFWQRLGFEKTVDVPHDGAPGFVILDGGAVEVMYQSRASVGADLPQLGRLTSSGITYVEVDSLDALDLAGAEVVVPRRRAFYGADELGVREPGGHVILFSAR